MARKAKKQPDTYDSKISALEQHVKVLTTALYQMREETKTHDYWQTPEGKDLLHDVTDTENAITEGLEELYDCDQFVQKVIDEGDAEAFSHYSVKDEVLDVFEKEDLADRLGGVIVLDKLNLNQRQELDDFMDKLLPNLNDKQGILL